MENMLIKLILYVVAVLLVMVALAASGKSAMDICQESHSYTTCHNQIYN